MHTSLVTHPLLIAARNLRSLRNPPYISITTNTTYMTGYLSPFNGCIGTGQPSTNHSEQKVKKDFPV
jgi:hypothetical protein